MNRSPQRQTCRLPSVIRYERRQVPEQHQEERPQ